MPRVSTCGCGCRPAGTKLEAFAKKRAGELLSRGTVYANLTVKRAGAAQTIRINEDVLSAVVKVAGTLAQRIDAVAPSMTACSASRASSKWSSPRAARKRTSRA